MSVGTKFSRRLSPFAAVYAYAAGQLLIAVLVGDRIGGTAWIGAQVLLAAPLVAVLFAEWPRETAIRAAVGFAIAAPALAGVGLLDPPWFGLLALSSAFGIVGYGIYRYELVSLGEVPEEAA